jgi:hypothetical protein
MEHEPVSESAGRVVIPAGMNGYRSEELEPIFEVPARRATELPPMPYPYPAGGRIGCLVPSRPTHGLPTPHAVSPVRSVRPARLVVLFILYCVRQAYASFGGTVVVTEIDSAKFAKLAKECGLVEGRLTLASVDVAFSKAKPKGARRLPFDHFENALGLIGACAVRASSPGPRASVARRRWLIHLSGCPLGARCFVSASGADCAGIDKFPGMENTSAFYRVVDAVIEHGGPDTSGTVRVSAILQPPLHRLCCRPCTVARCATEPPFCWYFRTPEARDELVV